MNIKFTSPTFLIIFFLLTGCGSKSVIVSPSDVYNNGLLVGRITGDNLQKVILNGYLTIDGKKYNKAIIDGYIMVSLKPGNHTVQDIGKTTTSRTGSLLMKTATKRIPLNRKFTIQPGQITNLGIVMMLSNNKGSEMYRTSFIDNSSDMEAFIGTKYSRIYNSLTNYKLLLADGKYLDEREIKTLRNILLSRLPEDKLRGKYTSTILGTMAKIIRKENDEISGFALYNTQTFEDIKTCSIENTRIACIIPNFHKGDRLLMSVKKGIAWRSLPRYQGTRFYLKLIGNQEIVIVTDRLKIFSSDDYAKNWQPYTDAQLKEPISESSIVGFSDGLDGYYIYSRDYDSTLLYRKFAGQNFVKLEIPVNNERLGGVQETSKGLYIGPDYTEFGKGKIFFQAKGETSWTKRFVPSAQCNEMALISREEDKVAVSCESKIEEGEVDIFISSDTGKIWTIKSGS